MNQEIKKTNEALPDLTVAQIEELIKAIRSNYLEEMVNFDNICCGSDGVGMGFRAALDSLERAYGLWEPEPEEDEEEDEE